MRYERIAGAVFGTPWFIREREARIMSEVVLDRIAAGGLFDEEARARVQAAQMAQGPRRGVRQPGDVAVLGIYGILMPRANLMTEFSGGTTVSSLRRQFNEALNDDAVKSILFDVDSPGGAADGIEELATEIRAARGRKPMVAVSNTLMCSAAYYLAAQADEVVASPSSITGSIGVYIEHVEFSKADEMAGVTTTIIRVPEAKHEINDAEPLPDAGRAHLEQIAGDYYDQFVNAVAKGRGVTASAVKAGYGEGRALTARRALAAGLVDRVGTLEETHARLAAGKGPMPRTAARVQIQHFDGNGQPITTSEAIASLIAPQPESPPVADTPPDRTTEAEAALALARAKNRR